MGDFIKLYLIPVLKWTLAIFIAVIEFTMWVSILILPFAVHWAFVFLIIPAILLIAVLNWYSEEILRMR